MTALPNPPRVPAQAKVSGNKRSRHQWSESARDELGEMRENMNPGVLVSQDFRTVNKHFTSAVDNGLKTHMVLSPYCEEVIRRARMSEEIAVKKMLFMTVLCISPEVQAYYASNCPPSKFTPWIATLRESLDIFLTGSHRTKNAKCTSKYDAKYRSVAAFVGAMTAKYVNM
jgi:hypothetical protein